jgi:hypothetical protein
VAAIAVLLENLLDGGRRLKLGRRRARRNAGPDGLQKCKKNQRREHQSAKRLHAIHRSGLACIMSSWTMQADTEHTQIPAG